VSHRSLLIRRPTSFGHQQLVQIALVSLFLLILALCHLGFRTATDAHRPYFGHAPRCRGAARARPGAGPRPWQRHGVGRRLREGNRL